MKQFFYLFKSKKKLLLFSIYFIVVIVGIFISYKGAYASIPNNEMILMKSKDPEMGLDFFYYLQDSGLTLYYMSLQHSLCLISLVLISCYMSIINSIIF